MSETPCTEKGNSDAFPECVPPPCREEKRWNQIQQKSLSRNLS